VIPSALNPPAPLSVHFRRPAQSFMSSITIVVPHWNRVDLLVPMLQHLRRQTHPIHEVLVVDNGSTDGSAEAAEEYGARVLRMGRNQGFARAVNRGIEECRTEHMVLINNDVEVSPEWLEELAAALRRDRSAWFATGKLMNMNRPDLIDGTFDVLSKGACAWRAGSQRKDGPAWNESREVAFPPGTAALFRTELFRRVGGFDETFESYLEDVELGLRCAIEGYRGVYVPTAVAFHLGSASLGKWNQEQVRLTARNQLLIVARHYPPGWFWRYGWNILVGQGLWGGVALRHGAGWAYLCGKWEGMRLFRAARRKATDPERLATVLEASERILEQLQRQCGFDAYWRWYFKLT
jgi:GT2 family glycosyltransferase